MNTVYAVVTSVDHEGDIVQSLHLREWSADYHAYQEAVENMFGGGKPTYWFSDYFPRGMWEVRKNYESVEVQKMEVSY